MEDNLNEVYLSLLPKYNPQPVFVFNKSGKILYQNESSKKILSEIKDFSDICQEDYCRSSAVVEKQKTEYVTYSHGKKTYLLALVGSKENDMIFAYGFNVSKVVESERKLKYQLITDNLTSLFNRNRLILDLEKDNNQSTLFLIDINNFGEINSFYGYKKGDKYLKKTAMKLVSLLRNNVEESHLYRLHGDVFAILIDRECSHEEAKEIADFLDNSFHRSDIEVDDVNIGIEVSIGVSSSMDGEKKKLLNLCEIALAEGKKRNRFITFYDDVKEVQEKYKENIFWTGKIKDILSGNSEAQIVSFFQPIYNLNNKAIEKFETLVRIEDGDEIIPPFKFLEPASKLGLLPKITDAMLERACQKFSGTEYEFSINLTKQDLQRDNLVEIFENILTKYDVKTNNVVLEVLEDESTYDNIEMLKSLQKRGFKIAIDDFGIGYSNFKRVQDLEADYIKIDGSLIKDLKRNDKDLPIVKAIVTYAKANGAKTIAEFVSSKEIYEKLESIGVDYLQGFYIGAPSPDINVDFSV